MNRHNFAYLERGRYVEQLQWWFDAFAREQFHFIKSEEFFARPAHVVARAFSFLGLPAYESIDYQAVNVGHYEALSPEARLQLQDYFRAYNEQLYQLLGFDLDWEQAARNE